MSILDKIIKPMIVISLLTQVIFPVFPVIHAQTVNSHEEIQQVDESVGSLADSMEVVSLPEINQISEDFPQFKFEHEKISGRVNESLDIAFTVNQKVDNVLLYFSDGVVVDQEKLGSNLSITPGNGDGEWILSSRTKINQATVPILVEQIGSYIIRLEDQSETIIEIIEKPVGDKVSAVDSHEEPKEENNAKEKTIEEIDLKDLSDIRNSEIPIRDFELTGIIGAEEYYHLIPMGAIPLKYSDESEIYYNGVLQTAMFSIVRAELASAEIRITNLGFYKGDAIEIVFNNFEISGEVDGITIHLQQGGVQIQPRTGAGVASYSMTQTARLMKNKEILDVPVIQGLIPYFRDNSIVRFKQQNVHSIFISDDYTGDATVVSNDEDFVFDLGTSSLVEIDHKKSLNLILDSSVKMEVTDLISGRNNALVLFAWPGGELNLEKDINLEASPVAGGNPTSDVNQLWPGGTTSISANPSTGYSFSRWEIVSGTGSSIANVNSANTTLTMGSSNTTIRAVYTQNSYSLTLQASPAAGGNPSATSTTVVQGGTTSISANPSTGYSFSRWEIVSGTGSSIANVNSANTTLTMGSSNTTIRAVYTQNSYSLTLQASPAAGGNPSATSTTVVQGGTTTISANPSTGYSFSRWEIVSGTGSSIANVNSANTTLTMGSSNTTIRAVYTQPAVPIRDFELTGIIDKESDFHLMPKGTVPLRFSDESEVYVNGVLMTGTLLQIPSDQLNSAEVVITNLGFYKGSPVEVVLDEFDFSGNVTHIQINRMANGFTIQPRGPSDNTRTSYSMKQTARLMENKELLEVPVILGIIPYYRSNSIVRIKQQDLHSVFLLDSYYGNATVASGENELVFDLGGASGGQLDLDRSLNFILNNAVRLEMTDILNNQNNILALFSWPIDGLFNMYDINIEASPTEGGNPTVDTNQLWQGGTTTISANPSIGYSFSRWEIVSGTGSSIANVNAANTTLTMGSSNTTIRAIFERIVGGNIEVNYIDVKGNKIADSIILSGNLNDEYLTEAKDIEGYFLLETPENATGTFKEEIQVVNYIYDKDKVDPKDPINPEIEVNPENKPDLSENQGLLSIDFVSQFNFGEQIISVNEKTFYAREQRLLDENNIPDEIKLRPNFVQISDRRPLDNREGWKVSVIQEKQFTSSSGHELAGAFLSFQNQQVVSASATEAPTIMNDDFDLYPGQKQTLLQATKSSGTGTWIYRFGSQETAGTSVGLTIPKNTTPRNERYEAKLLWELSAVPSN